MNNCQTVIFEKMKVVALVRIGLAYAVVSTLNTHWASQNTSSFLTHTVSAVDLASLQKSWLPCITMDAVCFDFSIPPSRGLLSNHRRKEKNWRSALAIKFFKALPWEGPCQLPCPRHCCSFLYSSYHFSPPFHFFFSRPVHRSAQGAFIRWKHEWTWEWTVTYVC